MMDAKQLKEEYESGRLESVARLKYLRTDLERICGVEVPRNPGEIREWYENNKSVIARRLNSEDEESKNNGEISEETSSDNTGDSE